MSFTSNFFPFRCLLLTTYLGGKWARCQATCKRPSDFHSCVNWRNNVGLRESLIKWLPILFDFDSNSCHHVNWTTGCEALQKNRNNFQVSSPTLSLTLWISSSLQLRPKRGLTENSALSRHSVTATQERCKRVMVLLWTVPYHFSHRNTPLCQIRLSQTVVFRQSEMCILDLK